MNTTPTDRDTADTAPQAHAPQASGPFKDRVVEVLKTVFDPEIPVNIYELGLVYKIETTAEGAVHVDMTLTSPMCPVAGSLPGEVQSKIQAIEGVSEVKVELVWDPPWGMEKMSEEAQLQLGFF